MVRVHRTASGKGSVNPISPGKVRGGIGTGQQAKDRPTTTTHAKKPQTQAPGPAMQGGSNSMQSAVPSRILNTRVVRRAGHDSGSVAPGKLVDYSKGFGVK